jgi:hypothetical protein
MVSAAFVRAALATALIAASAWFVTAAPAVAPRTAATLPSVATRPTSRPATTQAAGNEQDSERQAAAVADLASANDPEALRLPPDTRPATAPSTGPATSTATQPAARAMRRPIPRRQEAPRTPSSPVTDEEIGRAIEKGVDLLVGQFSNRTYTLRGPRGMESTRCGINALCVYALMQCGQATGDPRLAPNGPFIRNLVEAIKRLPADGGNHQTYARAIRAAALALTNNPKDRAQLEEDVGCLVYGNRDGMYSYFSAVPQSSGFAFRALGGPGDASNSQYGLLGVWSGAEVGLEIPADYWRNVERLWSYNNLDTGQWGYTMRLPEHYADMRRRVRAAPGTTSMTAAGIASLMTARQYLDLASGDTSVGRDPFAGRLADAFRWWEQGDHAINAPRANIYWGYTLYGIERVGLASGFKFFGTHEWYPELARLAVRRQDEYGSWGGLIDTSYTLLFLARGRHPVLMNKLRFDGKDDIQPDYWDNRPRDVAHLARFASRQLERQLNWQVVPITREWTDWTDSPILYLASHRAPRFRPAEIEKLRRFVEAGGILFTQQDQGELSKDSLERLIRPAGNDDPTVGGLLPGQAGKRPATKPGEGEFDRFVERLAAQLFPDYKLEDLPPTHPLYSSVYKLEPKPKLRAVTNGARLLLVHSPADVAKAWQVRDETKDRAQFELGVNLFVYAAGKRDYRNRLDSPYLPDPGKAPLGRVKVARLSYAGGSWSPEPGAWPRFARKFQWETSTGLDAPAIAWKDLRPGAATLAHLTGTSAYKPSAPEIAAMKAYVEAGGVLLIDDTGGSGAFAESLRPALAAAFPEASLRPLPRDHPLLNAVAPGMADLSRPALRLFCLEPQNKARAAATAQSGLTGFEFLRAGKGHVLFTTCDLTSGLFGTNTWGVFGYTPAYAEGFVQNTIFWAMDGQGG